MSEGWATGGDLAADHPEARTSLEERPKMELVIPFSGELISRDDPAACARALKEMSELEIKLRVLKKALAEVVLEESFRIGGKTIHFPGGITAKITAASSFSWDHSILAELVAAGLPAERYEALVTPEISYTINGSIAKEIAGANPVYAEILERARTRIPKTPSVSVSATTRL
jgi:hypothetical protein